MTVGINRLNQMFRDFKVAEDVGKMMELRRFEVEFEVFGTAYWQDKKRYYLVSKSEDTIYRQLQGLALDDTYPLPLESWRERALVPAGWDEEIEQQVKVHFCKMLHDEYEESFWRNVDAVTLGCSDDSALAVLDPLQEQLEGVFQADLLQLFEGLLNLVYLRKNLTRRSYQQYAEWLREIRQEMIDDVVTKDLFEKDLYGFAYEDGSGRLQYQLNASQRLMHEKREKQQRAGHLVTPIFQKKFWYNYDYRLDHVRTDFKAKLQRLFNSEYFEVLRKVSELPVVIDRAEYEKVLNEYREHNAKKLEAAWENLGYQWGIL